MKPDIEYIRDAVRLMVKACPQGKLKEEYSRVLGVMNKAIQLKRKDEEAEEDFHNQIMEEISHD